MFFWGGYSFNLPQQQEHVERPPLKYPVYVPPCPHYFLPQQGQRQLAAGQASSSEEELLSLVLHNRLHVRHAACGLKHAVIAVTDPRGDGAGCPGSTRVLGLGSNHNGQLGHRVATYTNTLVDLNHATGTGNGESASFFSGDIVSVACGLRHTLLSTSSGCVYVSGDNSCGQLGLDASTLASYAKARGRAEDTAAGGGADGGGQQGGRGGVTHFTQVRSLVHVKQVAAAHNASFAIDDKGHVFSWGDAQYGHLGHGGDHIVADEKGGLDRVEHVKVPRMIRWFERHRVSIAEVAVGKGHTLFMSKGGEDVYSCGEGYFGKLGHGSIDNEFDPRRLESFPERKQKEKVISIAAGDDCSLVLKANPVMGSVVYFFGKLTNGDGQLRPVIVAIPFVNIAKSMSTSLPQAPVGAPPAAEESSNHGAAAAVTSTTEVKSLTLTRVQCGRGNQCMALSADGRLLVWGRHSYTKLSNGTDADASKARPTVVASLEKYVLSGVASGGTLMLAWGSALRNEVDISTPATAADAAEEEHLSCATRDGRKHGVKSEDEEEGAEEMQKTPGTPQHLAEGESNEDKGAGEEKPKPGHAWDVVVPHDARVNTKAHGSNAAAGDADEVYEEGVRAFLTQYFGPPHARLAARYIADMPAAPPRTEKKAYAFPKIPTRELAVGQKVRLWMTNLYALGTITKVDAEDRDNLSALAAAAAAGEASKGSRPQSLSQTPLRSQGLPPRQSSSSSLLPASQAAQVSSLRGGTTTHQANEEEEGETEQAGAQVGEKEEERPSPGRRVLIEWERDDWRAEVVTLYSDDETLDEENANRWQPFWFEKNEEGDYVIAKSR